VTAIPPKAGLRGDYAHAADDYTLDQAWAAYTAEEHALWRRLYARQSVLAPRYACPEYLEALARLDCGEGVPRFDRVSRALRQATGWEIVAVPGLIPDREFFAHLAARRFPVTVWLRRPEEVDYIEEPDVFHDFYGHVPLLFEPSYAEHVQAYGAGGLKALGLDALDMLARLYWHTIEFGLVRTGRGLRACGAGLLSSGGELAYCIDDPAPRRIAFDMERALRTEYRIDRYQETYFVVDSFAARARATAPDFTPIYARVRGLPALGPAAADPGDRLAAA
jgi:phenylalanine-4-hydroxylase